MKFGKLLCDASQNDSFEREVWRSIQPYLLQIASDRHSDGCHILFENFSVKFIDIIRNIIREEEIYWKYLDEEDTTTTYERYITWNNPGDRTFLSDIMIRVRKMEATNFTICIERISRERLKNLKKKNRYIS